MEQNFESIIGLEIHVQLNTESKMFCSCPSGAKKNLAPNTALCPVCSGQPGALPVLNKKAVELALRAGFGFNAQINKESVFARKNYFYPDLPKGYQISQDDKPIIGKGYIEIKDAQGNTKKIGITRAHLEEDAGKSMHEASDSLVDLNRSGVPLLEIVGEPDLRSPQEAYDYLTNLRALLSWLDVSNCDMEKGELRVDVNVSVRPKGQEKFGTRMEIKNLNSFKAVKDALTYEINRQIAAVKAGETLHQQTMLWDEVKGETKVMRSKETAQEYRYFPEPDLKPLIITEEEIAQVRSSMPMLPSQKREYFEKELGLASYDAGILTKSRQITEYFEKVLSYGVPAKQAANWIGTDLLGALNACGKEIQDSPLPPSEIATLIKFIQEGKISIKMAREIFPKAFNENKKIADLVKSLGQTQINDEAQIEVWAKQAVEANPKAVADYKSGNTKAIGAMVGMVMKLSKGKANPAIINKILVRLMS